MADSRRIFSRFFEDPQSSRNGHGDSAEVPAVISVGETLRQRRLEFGYSLEDIEGALRIRQGHIAAIEDGRFDDLPAMVYVIGYIRSYAHLLELDGAALVGRFKEEAGAATSQTELQFRVPDSEPRGVPGGAAMLIGVVVAAIAYGSWYYLSTNDRSLADLVPSLPERLGGAGSTVATPIERSREPVVIASDSMTAELPQIPPPPTPVAPASVTPPVNAISGNGAAPRGAAGIDVASASQTELPQDVPPDNPPTAQLSPGLGPDAAVSLANPNSLANANAAAPTARRDPTAAVAAVPAPAPTPSGAAVASGPADQRVFGALSGTRVAIRAVQDSWVQIKDPAGNVIAARTLVPGDVFNVPDVPGMKMTTGNAGGLQIMVDGTQSPWMGRSGEVVRNVLLEAPNLMRGRNLGN